MTARKLWDLDDPPIVVVAGSGPRPSALAAALEATTQYGIERAEGVRDTLERLADGPVVDCIVVAGEDTDASAEAADASEGEIGTIERAREADPSLGIVYAPAAGSEELCARATAAGATDYVAAGTATDRVVERVDTAVDRAIERRHDAWKRSALDAIVEGFESNVFAKDVQARHLVHPSDVETDAGESLFGKTDVEAFGTSDETLEAAHEDDRDVIDRGERIERTLERYPDFDDGWQETTKVPWVTDGEVRGLVGVTRDVSDWKNRERSLLQRIGHLQRIPKYLTHDLRNPLAIAQGYAEQAKSGDEAALETVEESLQRLSRRLSEFHDFVDVAFDEETRRESVDLPALLSDVWSHVAVPGAELVLEVPESARIVADEEQLRPLVENLFRNAIDHAGPRVTVTVALHDDGFSVADDGPGFGVTDGDVFAAGTSGDATSAGIGLAIVDEVATLHSWSVETGESDAGGAHVRIRDASVVDCPLAATPVGDPLSLSGSTDVGDVERPGSATFGPDAVKLVGAGENVWGRVNEFHFASVECSGDVRIEATVAEMSVASEFSKAGVLVRSDHEAGAAYAGICRRAGRYPELLWRPAPGEFGQSAQLDGAAPGTARFRIDRVGETVVCSTATDGEEWIPVDKHEIALGESVAVGVFACSAERGEPIEVRFEDVAIRRLE